MKTVKYLLFCIETILLILSFIFGVACAESGSWLLAIVFMFGPFIYAKLVNIERHLIFAEAFEKEHLNG